MAEHPNVDRVRAAIEEFNEGDFEAYRRFFTDDVIWHVGGHHRLSGNYQGRDTIFQYFDTVRQITGGTLRSQPLEILADDSHAGIFAHITADRDDGRHLDTILAQAFLLNDQGQCTEYWALANNQQEVDAFWS